MSFMAYTWLLSLLFSFSITATAKQVYIVHMDHTSKPQSFSAHHDWYVSTLQSHTSSTVEDSLVYTYTHGFHGFAAYIDRKEAETLKQRDYVIDVHENRVFSVHTTRTPKFLGLDGKANFGNLVGSYKGYKNFKEIDQASHDIVIGVIDTGVWPESRSFDDTNMPDIPKNWRVVCESAPDFSSKSCNKKLISARSFLKSHLKYQNNSKLFASPRDKDGHGTHTSSTAAGSSVPNASLFGYANGTARGMASHARIATYRVCWTGADCHEADIIHGMIHAVNDGCHILSISLGTASADEVLVYYRDPIAIVALYAVQKGVVVSCSAGNSGPNPATVANTAPWIVTVGAATLDRTFPGRIFLSNKKNFAGVALFDKKFRHKPIKLVYYKDSNRSNIFCLPHPTPPSVVKLVRGKLVICNDKGGTGLGNSVMVKLAGGAGMILVAPKTNAFIETYGIENLAVPTVVIENTGGRIVKKYVKSDLHASASLSYGETTYNLKPTPTIASFSSRGPNILVPQILKPDLVAPGVNILAAWPRSAPVSQWSNDTRRSDFDLDSGTSMACPHVSGIIALLKVVHPDWSPSTIKSALMTTAYTLDNTNLPLKDYDGTFSTPLAHGAGHVNPLKALSPGLVYDISPTDYIAFLCSLGYPVKVIEAAFKGIHVNITCSKKFSDPGELNYPSFSILFEKGKRAVSYTRELTNVDDAGSLYNVTVNAPSSVTVTVKPTKLVFKNKGDKKIYTTTFVAKKGAKPTDGFASGSIVWFDPNHRVTTPITFIWA